ncbi:alanine dehydrogenase [Thiohalomonas denitrificans]|uniref:alanine dehydrogenase n=1 Tax=Thiohalomonas denitrificans TaxID=415747 RepID=UPI0026EA1AB4|nr:alanine dehydrogenase [Thiohalomonas denitrificans]
MRIGIPTEMKTLEGRVGLVPAAAAELVRRGNEVFIQMGAGTASGYDDEQYRAAGVGLLPDAVAVYERAEMVIKVKEPQPEELKLLHRGHLLFCYLHLAAEPKLMADLLDIGLTAVAFETVEADGGLPLLAPMSDIAGRVAAQVGAHLLHAPQGGKGLLLGGLPAAERGRVVVLGAGVAGGSATRVAAALGAEVTVFDKKREKLEAMRDLGPNVTALYPYTHELESAVTAADLLIGAVLIPGARAPHLVSGEVIRRMSTGSAVIDISVDQGGCIETTRPTTYADPTFIWEGVVHFGVTNMPGAVPRSASQALSAALLPFAERLAQPGWEEDPSLAAGINLRDGEIVHPALKT